MEFCGRLGLMLCSWVSLSTHLRMSWIAFQDPNGSHRERNSFPRIKRPQVCPFIPFRHLLYKSSSIRRHQPLSLCWVSFHLLSLADCSISCHLL